MNEDQRQRGTAARREFLQSSALAAGGAMLGLSSASAQDHRGEDRLPAPLGQPNEKSVSADVGEYDGFSRYAPSRGNSPDSDYYLGKLVPGRRSTVDGPAPFVTPDVEKLPWKIKDGAKEFELVAEPVAREFLPGYKMNVYGYNGSLPGPTIEVNQGDRVRLVVHNRLPEPTTLHCHGFELPVQMDGASELTQNLIESGATFVYEFDVHEEGTFFYHSHIPMQEAFGMVGFFIVHPKKPWDPPVDRDFGLIFQNFFIEPTQTISNSWTMEWNWHTINGRSGPYTTPLVCRHGERVRMRILDFSPMQHHPIHIHGHTFWITGHEGARIPKTAWIPRNTELIAVAQATDFELIANNPGDWMFHCHMVHHMMNHMTRQTGPRMRRTSVDRYLADLDSRPPIDLGRPTTEFPAPGYSQKMLGMDMSPEFMKRIWSRREVQGMRATWPMSVMGLMTVFRVLPDDLYELVMETNDPVEKGAVFAEIVRRYGTPGHYKAAPQMDRG